MQKAFLFLALICTAFIVFMMLLGRAAAGPMMPQCLTPEAFKARFGPGVIVRQAPAVLYE